MDKILVGIGAAEPLHLHWQTKHLMSNKENENYNIINAKAFHSVMACGNCPPCRHYQLAYCCIRNGKFTRGIMRMMVHKAQNLYFTARNITLQV